ncbi:DUF2071 domain-containing protein [Cellulosimicrobium cellulans]|uniref:DUF2071 domain-containing protein n=1 Tax=Cellulosimicrobium cellulans TaxID=1710 RepID=UPI003AF4C689
MTRCARTRRPDRHAAGVPYHPAVAAVTGDGSDAVRYRFRAPGRREPFPVPHEHPALRAGHLSAVVRAHEAVDATSGLAHRLTARSNGYGFCAGRLGRFPVEHEPWALRRGSLDMLETDLPRVPRPGACSQRSRWRSPCSPSVSPKT